VLTFSREARRIPTRRLHYRRLRQFADAKTLELRTITSSPASGSRPTRDLHFYASERPHAFHSMIYLGESQSRKPARYLV